MGPLHLLRVGKYQLSPSYPSVSSGAYHSSVDFFWSPSYHCPNLADSPVPFCSLVHSAGDSVVVPWPCPTAVSFNVSVHVLVVTTSSVCPVLVYLMWLFTSLVPSCFLTPGVGSQSSLYLEYVFSSDVQILHRSLPVQCP